MKNSEVKKIVNKNWSCLTRNKFWKKMVAKKNRKVLKDVDKIDNK